MPIVHKTADRVVRSTTAKYEYTVDGEPVSEEIRVLYYSPTIADLEELQDRLRSMQGEISWLATDLAARIHSLPDIVNEKGKPVEITAEFFKTVTLQNLESIQKAVNEHLHPKSEAATSANG